MNKKDIVNILLNLIKYGACVALISPLLFDRNFFFSFVSLKTIFFRIVVDLIFILYLILIYFDRSYLPKINKLNVSIFLFIFSLFIASIFGVNFERSFLSNFERMVGLLTFIYLFVFYIILISVFKNRRDWEHLFSVSIITAIPISFMVLMNKGGNFRGGGSLGNSSFFASYILFNIFFALILMISNKNNSIGKSLYIIALFIFLLSLFFNPTTITEGAVSSLLIGLVVLIALAMWFSRNSVLKKAAPIFFILMVIFGFYVVKEYRFPDKPFNLLDIPDPSRKANWSIALKAIQERPILGWGWENYNTVFSKYYDPIIPLTGGDIWYDRAHNIIFDTLVSGGIVSTFFYFSIFFVSIFYLIKIAKTSNFDKDFLVKTAGLGEREIVLISLSLVSLLIVYFLQNLWVFDMISSYIMFFLTLGFIDFFAFQKNLHKPQQNKLLERNKFKNIAIIFLIILTLFSLYYSNIKQLLSSYYIAQTGYSFGELNIEKGKRYLEKAIKTSSISIFEAPSHSLDVLYELTQNLIKNNVSITEKEKYSILSAFKESLDFMEKSVQKNKYDIRPRQNLSGKYNYFYILTGEKEYLKKSLDNINFAENISPLNQEVLIQKSFTLLLLGDKEGAENYLKKAINVEPRYIRPREIIVNFYKDIGEEKKAEEEYLKIKEINEKNNQK
jgi:O-antigen ligase